jgi:hypothetical protein
MQINSNHLDGLGLGGTDPEPCNLRAGALIVPVAAAAWPLTARARALRAALRPTTPATSGGFRNGYVALTEPAAAAAPLSPF